MGQQIGFIMSPSDETQFLEYVKRETRAIMVLGGPQDSAAVQELVAMPEPFSRPHWFNLYLVLGTCQYKPIPGSNSFYLDPLRSEVIEFTRTVLGSDRFEPGRLWVEFTYWGEHGEKVPKPPVVRQAFQKLAAHLRKTYRRTEHGYYLGPGAADMVPRLLL